MEVDSQDESDGEDYMDIDGSRLSVPHAGSHICWRGEVQKGLDMMRSMPDKVGTQAAAAVIGPCADRYC